MSQLSEQQTRLIGAQQTTGEISATLKFLRSEQTLAKPNCVNVAPVSGNDRSQTYFDGRRAGLGKHTNVLITACSHELK